MIFFTPSKISEYRKIKKLYRKSFPKCERKPFSVILKMMKKGKSDIIYFEEDGMFLGFATTINSDSLILIDYFAVNHRIRGQGYGSKMLRALLSNNSPKGVFLEIEIPYEDAPNYNERKRRKDFYLRAGLSEINTKAKLFGVDMELMGFNCTLDYNEYKDFYLVNYGKYAFDHIEPVNISLA